MIALTVTTNLGSTPWTDLRGVQAMAKSRVSAASPAARRAASLPSRS